MHKRLCFAVVAAVLFAAVVVEGQQPVRDPKKEHAICEQLAVVAPAAVETFQRATAAMDSRDYSQAAQLYRDVLKQAPAFSPAIRRLGFSLAGLGQTDDGLALLENAVKIERSPDNLMGLAELLTYPGEKKEGSIAQRERALALAKEANGRNQNSDDPDFAVLTAQIALSLKNEEEFRQATEILVRKYPDQMATHYFNAIQLAMGERWIAAEDEMKRAQRLGLPAQTAEAFLASGIHTRATAWRWVHYGFYLLAAWVFGLFTLFVAGKVFSKLTLRFIENAELNSSVSGAEAVLRKYYRGLINVAGTYYYVSIPFVIFLVLTAAGGIVYGFLVLGQVPIKLVAVLVFGAIVTVYKMLHSLFIRVSSKEPGRSLSPEEAPGLWSLTREVAENLGTRPFDDIRVAPGTEMAVYERGSYRDRRKDLGRRTLVIGLGLLPGFDQTPFRAVLAHEFGHLSHRDTAGGDVAMRVNQDMMKFAYAMVRAGQNVWWNIAFQFLRVYHFLFRRISYGATRLQEVLADRAAARLYGAQPFEEGLRHVVRRQIEFHHFARKEIKEAVESGRALQNLYALEVQPEKMLEEQIDHAINRQTSEDDTHPSPVERFRLVSRVICQRAPDPSGPMWELFADREAIAKEMSSQVERIAKGSLA
jgi:Zn-dependent protease with chaperone function/tetratricopeptide (TPR) repeat protein